MTAHFSLLLVLPLRRLCSLWRKWVCIKTWAQLVTRIQARLHGGPPLHHLWLNMSGHSKRSREGNYFILPIFTEVTHIHECTHSQKCAHARACRHADAAHEHTPSVKELDVNQDADERQLNTHIPSWTCYRFTCAVYVSECTEGCLCNRRQAGEKWNGDLPTGLGHIAMLHTDPAPSPGPWLISPVKMFTQRIPLSNARQVNFNP